jgi:predicted DNA-binding protein
VPGVKSRALFFFTNNGCNGILTISAITAIIIANIANMEVLMQNTVNRTRYFLDIEPELRNRLKAMAALKGKSMKEWLTEAIIAKMEDEIDSTEGLAALVDTEGTLSLENYLASRKTNNS